MEYNANNANNSIIRDRANLGKVPIVIVPFIIIIIIIIIIILHFAGDLHHLNVYEKSFLFGKVVGAGEKFYILFVTFMSHTWKTSRWRSFKQNRNAHNSTILCRTFKNLISIHAEISAAPPHVDDSYLRPNTFFARAQKREKKMFHVR